MNGAQERVIYKRPDGKWANQCAGAAKPTSLHPTQREAIDAAREALAAAGGGEYTVVNNGRGSRFGGIHRALLRAYQRTARPGSDKPVRAYPAS